MKLKVEVQPVGMEALADQIARDLGRRIESALRKIGRESEGFVKQLISVPVERLPGGHVIRSSPGEPPRKDTGELYANVGSTVVANGLEYSMIVYSERPSTPAVPVVLEGALNRPYMVHLHERLRQQMPNLLAQEMRR